MAPNALLEDISIGRHQRNIRRSGDTFLGRRDNEKGVQGEEEEGGREFVTKQPKLARRVSFWSLDIFSL